MLHTEINLCISASYKNVISASQIAYGGGLTVTLDIVPCTQVAPGGGWIFLKILTKFPLALIILLLRWVLIIITPVAFASRDRRQLLLSPRPGFASSE